MAVDSLDEAGHVAHKASEVNGLLHALDELDRLARRHGLLGFPIGLVFTVREDYWERWNMHFEGRNATMLRQRFSTFSDDELDLALERYAHVYSYRYGQPPSPAARRVLAVPVNLLVFSEANKFEGAVDAHDVLTENVLALYFTRKQEDVLKRQIVGFSRSALMRIAGAVAMRLATADTSTLRWEEVADTVANVTPLLETEADEVVRVLVSEQILAREADDERQLRFRHTRFVEYLVAHHIAQGLGRGGDTTAFLTDRLERVFAARLLSPYKVYDLLKHICDRDYPQHLVTVTNFFAGSSDYMTLTMSRLRADVAYGTPIGASDLELVVRSTRALDPSVAREGFFVLAAKPNQQPAARVIEAFVNAWEASEGRSDRWRLLQKLGDLGLSLDEAVFKCVLDTSEDPREWEVFLGLLLERNQDELFVEMLADAGASVEHLLPTGEMWAQARHLLAVAISGEPYVLGECA